MWIFLVDVFPEDSNRIRAVIARDQALAHVMVMEFYKEWKAAPSIRIYAGWRLRDEVIEPNVICLSRQ